MLPKLLQRFTGLHQNLLALALLQMKILGVLSACKEAGRQLIKNGYIEEKVINEISSVGIDVEDFRKYANLSWDLCIKEHKTPAQMQKELLYDTKI